MKSTDNMFIFRRFLREYLDLRKDKENENNIIENIRNGVEFKGATLWILIFAVFMASLGLKVNSTAVIIGAMLISPLMGPIMGIGLAVGINDLALMKRSVKNMLIATAFGVAASTLFFLCSPITEAQSELLARTSPTIYDVFIALLGGMAGIIAVSTKEKGNVIPGVAIATALMPPLCTAGFGLATGNLIYFLGAFYLYFINTVFISVATYIGTRILRFQSKEFIDKEREKKVHKYILLIVILTMCPAIYLTFGIIKDTLYESAANRFINENFDFVNTQILNRKISHENKEIQIILVGAEVPEESLALAKSKMKNYGLETSKLTVIQGMNNEAVDLSSIRAMVMEDFYKNSEKQILEQKKTIDTLKEELTCYERCNILSREMVPELKVLYPDITSLALSKMIQTQVDSARCDTITLAYLRFKKKPTKQEQAKLKDWLQARTGTKKLHIILE